MSFDEQPVEALSAVIIARHNIALVREWAENLDYKALSDDRMRCYAILYAFVIIAGAIKDIPKSVLERYASPKLWRDVNDFRNYLAHVYDDLPDNRIIGTIHKDLPTLDDVLKAMLNDLSAQKP